MHPLRYSRLQIGDSMGTFKENVSANLKRILREKNLNQRDLAKIIGVSEPSVHSWIVGRSAPRPEQFDRIQDRLGIPPSQITSDPDGLDDPKTKDISTEQAMQIIAKSLGFAGISLRKTKK